MFESWSLRLHRLLGADLTTVEQLQTDSKILYKSLYLIIKNMLEVQQRLRRSDACQRSATVKGTVPNGRHRLGDCDAFQRTATVKGTVPAAPRAKAKVRSNLAAELPFVGGCLVSEDQLWQEQEKLQAMVKQVLRKFIQGQLFVSDNHAAFFFYETPGQPSKAPSLMAVTDSGIAMLSKDLQSLKAPSPMAVTDSGIAMLSKDLQSLKAPSPMAVTDSGIAMLSKDLQSLKAPSPMAVTDSGIAMLSQDLQSLKAPSPMAVTDSGIAMLSKDLQSLKAPSPMAVTDPGLRCFSKICIL